ncbi:MAG: alpha/beta fold hydrolase [Rubellimicrobium sp.]|nr:alpha/beta fold hydrolase [Rubellimicrobium sp.]
MLNLVRHGSPADRAPLVIAHGLFGSARNWGVIARRLSDTRQVIAVDMRNHGASPWSDSHGYGDMAEDLAGVITAEVAEAGGTGADVLGHSMGGKAAMVLALTRPDLVRRLVVADIAPVAYHHSQQPQIDAMRRVDPATVANRAEAEARMQAADPAIAAFLLQSLDMAERRWRLNVDVLEREMAGITGWPGTQGRFDGPTLFLSGAASDYIRAEHRPTIKAQFPQARFAKIPGAGHWLHAERPREFEAAVRTFLDAQVPGAAD